MNGALGVVLTLLFEALLALQEFFAVKRGDGVENRLAGGTRIGQVAAQAVPWRGHGPQNCFQSS
ncbi:hypothetical protein D3C83_114570 [compost metagenome]